MVNRRQLDIATDLGRLPLPPHDLWIRPRRRRAVGTEQLTLTAALLAFLLLVAAPIASSVVSQRQLGQSPQPTKIPASIVPATASQIAVSARLIPIDEIQNIPIRGDWNYVVDMTLTNTVPDGDYAVDVYPYLAGIPAVVMDFGSGFDAAGRVIGGTGITSGANGWRLRAAAIALGSAKPAVAVPNGWRTEGISFVGNHGSVRVRFAVSLPVSGSLGPSANYRLVVVYSSPHDSEAISWTNVIQVETGQGQ